MVVLAVLDEDGEGGLGERDAAEERVDDAEERRAEELAKPFSLASNFYAIGSTEEPQLVTAYKFTRESFQQHSAYWILSDAVHLAAIDSEGTPRSKRRRCPLRYLRG